jgi:malate/lactate dehydrogenase
VYLSLPAAVGRTGVEQIPHLLLDPEETSHLRGSAVALRGVLDELG